MRTPLKSLAKAAFIRPLPILFILIIWAIGVQTMVSCSGDDGGGDSNCSLNGGTVNIGEQVWMAENLNCNVSGSVCYDNNPANCDKYGRLYDWSTAMALPSDCNSTSCSSQISVKHRGICPSGWHIPSKGEWYDLLTAVGGASTAGTKLKSTSGWADYYEQSGNGTDDYGFSALPGGWRASAGNFFDVVDNSFWWGASEESDNLAYYRYMMQSARADYGFQYKYYGLSVRCIKD